VELSILDAVGRVNETQRRVLGERVAARFGADLSGHWFAIWGLAFKPGTAIRELMRTPVLFDGRNLREPGEVVNLGFEYFGIGRRVVHPAATAFEESQVPALVA